MAESSKSMNLVMKSLEERAKELNCLYKIEEILSLPDITLPEIFQGVIEAIPDGWQYPKFCTTGINYGNDEYRDYNFEKTQWSLKSDIIAQDEKVGFIELYYTKELPPADEGPFLKEERRLIDTIAERLGHYIFHQRLKGFFEEWNRSKKQLNDKPKPEWSVVLDMLRSTDQHLFSIISRKMINNLFFRGVEESKGLFKKLGHPIEDDESTNAEVNRPSKKKVLESSYFLGMEIFRVASSYFSDDEILNMIQKWIFEDKSSFLLKALANPNTPLVEIADAIRKYHHINPAHEENSPVSKGIRVSLVRRFLSDQLQFINIAKNYIIVSDFYRMLEKLIFPSESHGKLGGKSSGLILAKNILKRIPEHADLLSGVKTPKTWYISSDGLHNFIYYNNLEDVIDQKYKDIDLVRQEYPHIIQVFKNSHFPPEVVNGLSRALDDFEDSPIIVRSSSLLEDRMGAAFAGKYKSLFLANQGTKKQKLDALMDAIAEVYASTFGPDPIGYRYERNLVDFNEEMGIMIQEVVGKKYGKYFFPAFAGVAFSNNEFRWSARINRDDGLIRIVPGLGTRAVDRVGDDYPILLAPGQPNLRVNLTFEEIIGYAPKNMDVLNLESNIFETVPLRQVIREVGNRFPMINEIFSIKEEKHLKNPVGLGVDTNKHDIVATFENLISNTNYINQIHTLLRDLKDKLRMPVDVEFACDGESLYLLQCRPQSYSEENVSAIIPKDISPDRIVFSANKHVSNGRIPDLTHIVYVDPDAYGRMKDLNNLKAVGHAIGKLNKILPSKKFILMGPGRWGSRDDIRLGVKVSYSDINNTSMLIEIARKKGKYVPDLSFGTHFFQDLVESSIRYLPLYPDDNGTVFNDVFFTKNKNILMDVVPDYGFLEHTIKVIDIPKATNGLVMRVLLNAEEEEALAILTDPMTQTSYQSKESINPLKLSEEPWMWRMRMVEAIANDLDTERFGVKNLYVFGSSVDESARPNSDIDVILHFNGSHEQKKDLMSWLEGWSQCLQQVNFEKTGYIVENMLDVKFITSFDIQNNTALVRKMNSVQDFAKKLSLNK